MKLFLQFGFGMMAHCQELLQHDVGTGVILSPRDLDLSQLLSVASDASGKEVLFDPQCYIRDANHARLTQHVYWKAFKSSSTNSILNANGAVSVVQALMAYNIALGSTAVILPGIIADEVTPDWLLLHAKLAAEGIRQITDRPVYATIALSAQATADEVQIEATVEEVAQWNVAGVYLVPQAPKYLVEDVNWLANLLILAAGIKLRGKQVIVGYANHQLLCTAAANVDAIASGTWLNVRAFDPDKFYIPEENATSRRTRWYYCPHALSEFKIVFLDAARRAGILAELRPNPNLRSSYADPLFAGAMPTSVNWPERSAFRHYLTCLDSQVRQAHRDSFDSTVDAYRSTLDVADSTNRRFRDHGVLAGDRGFGEIVDINRSAVTVLTQARGAQLRRMW